MTIAASTIERTALAAAIIVLGFMIWGIHKDISFLSDGVSQTSQKIVERVEGAASKLDAIHAKISMPHFTTGIAKIGKPRVKPVKHLNRPKLPVTKKPMAVVEPLAEQPKPIFQPFGIWLK